MSTSDRAMVAAKLAKMPQGARTDLEPRANLHEVSAAQAGALLNVSERTVKSAKQVQERGAPERGEARTRADNQHVPDGNKLSPEDVGLTRKDIHEARDDLANILQGVGIEIVDVRVRRRAGQTCAEATIRKMLAEHDVGHVTFVLRTIVESEGNGRALTAPTILAVSDIVTAHPAWADRGEEWLQAFDGIDLEDLERRARLNRGAAPKRGAIATMIYAALVEFFQPAKPKGPHHGEDRGEDAGAKVSGGVREESGRGGERIQGRVAWAR